MADEVNKEGKDETVDSTVIVDGKQSPSATQGGSEKTAEQLVAEQKAKEIADKSKPKEEEKPKEKTEEEKLAEQKNADGSWKDAYVTIDNEHASAAIDLLKEANVAPIEANDIFQKAIASGDLNDVNWEQLEKRVGKSKASLIKAGVTQYYNDEYKAQDETSKKGYELFGGKENWDTVAKHFKAAEQKDPALKSKVDSIRKAINAGGWAAETALTELKSMYEKDPTTKGLNNGKLERGSSIPQQSADQDIDGKTYQAEYAKLMNRRAPESEILALRARRMNTMKKEQAR